jgi:hypothetical protein
LFNISKRDKAYGINTYPKTKAYVSHSSWVHLHFVYSYSTRVFRGETAKGDMLLAIENLADHSLESSFVSQLEG